jgi:DNA-binding phage protein
MKTTLTYHQERLLLHCQEAIADAIDRSGLKRSQIAERIGKNKSFVTQALSTGRNLTVSSLASLLWAAGFQLEANLMPISQSDDTGEMHSIRLVPRSSSYESSTPPPITDDAEQECLQGAAA